MDTSSDRLGSKRSPARCNGGEIQMNEETTSYQQIRYFMDPIHPVIVQAAISVAVSGKLKRKNCAHRCAQPHIS